MDESAFRAAEQRYWARVGLTPDEQWVRLPTGSRVRVQGVGDGPPALLLHGVNNAGVMLAGLAALLPSHRCLVLDRPGCGLSSMPATPPTTRSEFFEHVDGLVPGVLDALGLAAAALVSTSMGGLYAIRAAATAPGRVRSIAHLGWSMGAPLARLPVVMRPANTRAGARMMARMPVARAAVRPMLRNIGLKGALAAGAVPDQAVDALYSLLRHTDTMRNELRLGPLLLDRMQDVVIPDELLARVSAPVLLLWGTEDPMGGPEVARAFAARIPGAEVEILDGAGHAPWFDEPERVAQRLAAFLAA